MTTNTMFCSVILMRSIKLKYSVSGNLKPKFVSMFAIMRHCLIDDFKDKNKGLFAKIKQLDDGNFVAAVVDPLARRVHKVKI